MKIEIVSKAEQVPTYAVEGDAGCDLKAAESVVLRPGQRALVKTGVTLALPEGIVALVHPRSGLALKHGVTVLNAPGVIDSGYRGEVGVILHNTDLYKAFFIEAGDRIAQLVFQEYVTAKFDKVLELSETTRGSGGFGHSGTN